MKFSIVALIILATLTSSVSAATTQGNGGPTSGFNTTTKQVEMIPQCFPWTWLSLFLAGDISAIYKNQKACQEQRFIDFGV